jgi:hypothetical protein
VAETAPDIEISIDFEIGDADSDTARLTQALQALQRTTDLVARGVVLMAEGQRTAGSATRAATQATQAQASATTAAATQAIQFTQRVGAAANAVQSLATAFGSHGQTAGLIGRTAASAAAFAQLGSVLGPGGTLVGGILGAAIPAFQGLSAAEDAARVSAQQLTASLSTLITRTREAYAAQAQMDTLSAGGGSIAEQSAFTQQAEQRRQLIERALGGDAGAIRELRAAGLTGRSDSDPSAFARVREALGGGRATELDDSEREMLRSRADFTTDRVHERIGLQEQAIETQTDTRTTSPTRGGGGGGDRLGQQRQFRSGMNTDITQELDATAQLLALEEERRQSLRALREQRDSDAEAAARNAEQEQADLDKAIEGIRVLKEEESAAAQARKESEEQELERMEADSERKKALYEQQIQAYQEVTGVLVNGLVKASEAIADGSASAEEAFKGLLGSFLQYISQRAALEAAAEFAQAIGSFASYNYAAGAQHLAAGALWAGVAVATGVGGAAIARPSVPTEQGPARPPTSDGTSDRGGGTTVINWNSPVVTAQTEATLGRQVGEMVEAAQQRF